MICAKKPVAISRILRLPVWPSHPKTGDLYVIASVGKLLVVLSKKGKIKSVQRLNPDVFKQPEGICFMPNGDLLIANEARFKSTNSNLLRFSTDTP